MGAIPPIRTVDGALFWGVSCEWSSANIFEIEVDVLDASKFERTQIHFFTDVFTASRCPCFKVPVSSMWSLVQTKET